MPKPLPDLLTIPQAAKVLKVTRQAVSQAIARGVLKSTQIGHVHLISKDNLVTYKASRHPGGRPKSKKKY